MIDNKRKLYLDAMILKRGIIYSGDMDLYDFLDAFVVLGRNMEEKIYIISFVCKNIKFMPNATICSRVTNVIKSVSSLVENSADKLADIIVNLPSINVPDYDEIRGLDTLKKDNIYRGSDEGCSGCEYFNILPCTYSNKFNYQFVCNFSNRKYPVKDREKETCKPRYFGLISMEEKQEEDKSMYGVCPKLKK